MLNKIKQKYLQARKEKNKELVLQLGRVISRINEVEKNGVTITDEVVIEAIKTEIKQGKVAIEPDEKMVAEFPNGDYPEKYFTFIENEKRKMKVLEDFLPKQLNEDEILSLIKEKGGKKGMNMGQLMGLVLSTHKAFVDTKLVNEVIRKNFMK